VKQNGLLFYLRKQLHPFLYGGAGSLIKRKDLPEWEASIVETNTMGNKLPVWCSLHNMAFSLTI